MKTTKQAYRQGDVLLRPSPVPSDAKRITLRPAALGEVTGHHHSFMSNIATLEEDLVEMYEGADGKTYVRILGEPGDVALVHQEHKAHPTIAPGDYAIVIQQENSDWGSRAVLD
jgi:hypothetical protein